MILSWKLVAATAATAGAVGAHFLDIGASGPARVHTPVPIRACATQLGQEICRQTTDPHVRTAMFVDQRANTAKQIALMAMANELSKGIVGTIVQVTPTAIQFADHGSEINVSAAQVSLEVSKHLTHEPTCGAMQWFHPFASMDESAMGVANQHLFTGSALGTKWSDPNKRSAFFGTFSY